MSHKKHSKKSKKEGFYGTKTVKVLKENMFEHFLSEQDVALVMFFDPKNAQSQLSKPHFVKAAMSTKKPNITFASVNCADEKNLCRAEQIMDLPTMKLYSRGRFMKKQNPMVDYKALMKVVEEVPLPPKHVHRNVYRV